MKETIRHKYRGYLIYAHNGGKFDFNFLVEHLKSKDRRIELIMRGSVCVKLLVYHNKKYRNCTKFADSLTLLPYSLDKLTHDFKVKHKKQADKIGSDYELLYKLYLKGDPLFFKYLRYDVFGLFEVLNKFYNLIQKSKGQVGLTLASTSLKTFKSSSLNYTLKMTNRDLNDEMKQAYYGGRTEIFKQFLPEDKYFCFDINSLYPYVMRDNYYPISAPMIVKNPSPKIYKQHEGLTFCMITAPDDLYLPLLPCKHNHKLFFPIGKFRGMWDNALLTKADDLGYKIFPLKAYVFKTEKLFKEYVDRFYKLKQNSVKDSAPYTISKLLLNSLYGKFAQSQDSEKIIKLNLKEANKRKESIIDIVDPDYGLFKVKSNSKGNHFIPQISIHVTALAQLELYKYMESIISKGYNVAYCDTDSIFTNFKLNTSNKLGGMKLEYPFNKGYFLLPKTYCVINDGIDYIKAKGYIPEFRRSLSEDSFKKALFGNDYSDFVMESELQFNSMKQSYRRHHTFVSMDRKRKSIRIRYDKRKVNGDYTTKPYTYRELMDN